MNLIFLVRLVVTLMIVSFVSITFGGTITTVAGTGKAEDGPNSGSVRDVNIGQPFGVEFGPDGALYITEVQNHRVRRLDLKSGRLSTVAGCGQKGYSGDGGPATDAKLNEPYEVRFDREGNMFFVEMQNHLVRKVDVKTKLISTVAGTGQPGFSGDGGPATKATFRQPHSIVFDEHGGLYVADIGNHRVRKVDLSTGLVSTFAGNGEKKLPTDGQAAEGNPMIGPRALFLRDSTLWIALREGHSVWKVDLTDRKVKHVAGTGKAGFSGDDGPAVQATFNGPKGIVADSKRNLFIMDTENQAVRRIDGASGQITTIAGSGPKGIGFAGDGGEATKAKVDRPHGICVGPDGSVYIGDTNNHRVRGISP